MDRIPPPEMLDALTRILWYVVENELTDEQRVRVRENLRKIGLIRKEKKDENKR